MLFHLILYSLILSLYKIVILFIDLYVRIYKYLHIYRYYMFTDVSRDVFQKDMKG